MGEKKLEPWITTEDLMEILGVSKDTIERLRSEQGLPYYKVGARVRFRVSEVERWMKERRHNG